MAFSIPKSSFTQHRHKNDEAPVDTGLIRCVCPSTEDDGFTIQCERCLVWQHAFCVHITHANIPDHYLCDQCLKRKRPKLSKRITISKKKFRKLDASEEEAPLKDPKKKRPSKSRIISRYVHSLFKEARERWSSNNRWRQHFHDESSNRGPLLCDHGPFVTMDTTTLFTKGVLMDTPVSSQGLFATRSIPTLRYLMEVTGNILLKSEFKFDPINDFVILGTPSSHIMFYPTLDLCIDTRQFGNKARYIRRSCHPNAELRNVVLPQSREDKTIHLGLFARHAIEKGEEITISWNWQRGHVAWKENMNWHHQHKQRHGQEVNGHQVIDEEEERRRKLTIKNMLDRFEKEFGVCACVNKRRCLIEHLKRQCAPPREKPIVRFPSINIISNKGDRRKSSVILLKPKSAPSQPVKLDEKHIETTTIEPTFVSTTLSKDTSDDELLDVEGDIDIGDDLPPPLDNAPPLLDDNSSDEENADLSSLSSLSSLSVFEGSVTENSDDDESKARPRKKKSIRHHHKANKRNATTSSATANILPVKTSEMPTALEKSFAPLPRKKLWIRDYLNKNNNSESAEKPVAVADKFTLKPEQENVGVLEPKEEPAFMGLVEEKPTITDETVHSRNTMEPPQGNFEAEQYTKFVRVDTFDAMSKPEQHLIPESNVQQLNDKDEKINVEQDVDSVMAEAEIVDVMRIDKINTFDMDEGELSDASTILLDDDEREQVYRRDVANAPLNPANFTSDDSTKSSPPISQQEQCLILKDRDITPSNGAILESEHSSSRFMDLVEAAIIVSSAEDTSRL
ncbi:hypothetical protein BD408DRAFT_360707 [Parasitella parasitica]|nr:hypothetical protein BD408DRAFT_360707 [Parasitella parasitica]